LLGFPFPRRFCTPFFGKVLTFGSNLFSSSGRVGRQSIRAASSGGDFFLVPPRRLSGRSFPSLELSLGDFSLGRFVRTLPPHLPLDSLCPGCRVFFFFCLHFFLPLHAFLPAGKAPQPLPTFPGIPVGFSRNLSPHFGRGFPPLRSWF